jgi:hypothetical protein
MWKNSYKMASKIFNTFRHSRLHGRSEIPEQLTFLELTICAPQKVRGCAFVSEPNRIPTQARCSRSCRIHPIAYTCPSALTIYIWTRHRTLYTTPVGAHLCFSTVYANYLSVWLNSFFFAERCNILCCTTLYDHDPACPWPSITMNMYDHEQVWPLPCMTMTLWDHDISNKADCSLRRQYRRFRILVSRSI